MLKDNRDGGSEKEPEAYATAEEASAREKAPPAHGSLSAADLTCGLRSVWSQIQSARSAARHLD